MPILLNPQMMRQIIMDHYDNPRNKREPKNDQYQSMHMDSENCVDDIMVYMLAENDIVVDCCFTGVACTISTASTDIMCDLVVGKSLKDAKYIIDQFNNMVHEQPYDDSVLDEALVFMNTAKQAARIRCATIGWTALDDMVCNCPNCKK
ncbi:MAG: SUF system NifU family Fe-S cluster assembly protein [Bacilli bacterium]|nr:SUF system NifU family Fe-S cluster assembly protein [Bacilli bacterium]